MKIKNISAIRARLVAFFTLTIFLCSSCVNEVVRTRFKNDTNETIYIYGFNEEFRDSDPSIYKYECRKVNPYELFECDMSWLKHEDDIQHRRTFGFAVINTDVWENMPERRQVDITQLADTIYKYSYKTFVSMNFTVVHNGKKEHSGRQPNTE
ncbi:MAG: hypothetical protein J6C78_07600 [Muribaculaceae bacterium]|nr:hypothetical protein [Muribaculaceae bacterium]